MSRQIVEHYFPPDDYMPRLDALWSAIQDADKDESPRLATEGDPGTELREQYRELSAAAKEAAREANRLVRIRAVSRGDWRKLKEAHPPRTEGDPETVKADRLAGLNLESVEDDLVFASLEYPEFKSRAAFDEWADDLAAGEWATITHMAWEKANIAEFDPKSPPPLPTRKSDATSV